MSQRERKQLAGQLRAIREHEAKKARYAQPHEKARAQKTIDNAQRHVDKLRGRKK